MASLVVYITTLECGRPSLKGEGGEARGQKRGKAGLTARPLLAGTGAGN